MSEKYGKVVGWIEEIEGDTEGHGWVYAFISGRQHLDKDYPRSRRSLIIPISRSLLTRSGWRVLASPENLSDVLKFVPSDDKIQSLFITSITEPEWIMLAERNQVAAALGTRINQASYQGKARIAEWEN